MMKFEDKLTKNFSVSEFVTYSDFENFIQYNDRFKIRLRLIADKLHILRQYLNSPIIITSGFRNINHNRLVGGVPNSYHTTMQAVDCYPLNMDFEKIYNINLSKKLFSGSIFYQDKKFIHFDIRNTTPYHRF